MKKMNFCDNCQDWTEDKLRTTWNKLKVCELCFNDEFHPSKRYDSSYKTDWLDIKGNNY